ncbi:MAG: zinc ribbon domain-containing protein [Sedimentibacter sp.]
MFCESCGKNIPDDSRFCEYCGSKVTVEADTSPKEETITENSDYVSVIKREEEAVHSNNVIPKKSGFVKKAAILIIAAAAVIFGGFSLISQLLKEDPKTESNALNDVSRGNSGKSEPEQPSENPPVQDSFILISEEDFEWYSIASYDQMPEGASALSYMDILGEWKVMAVNYVSEPAESYFSIGIVEEYSPSENDIGANTSVTLMHQYIEVKEEKHFFDEDNSTDMVLCSYGEGVLEMVLGDDKILDIIFWEKEGKQYGQSHLYRDDDNDGFADLITSVAFVR